MSQYDENGKYRGPIGTATGLLAAHEDACVMMGRVWLDDDNSKRLSKAGPAHSNFAIVLATAGALSVNEGDAHSAVFTPTEFGLELLAIVRPLIPRNRSRLRILHRASGIEPITCQSERAFIAGLEALIADCETQADVTALHNANATTIGRCEPSNQEGITEKLATRFAAAHPTRIAS